MSSESAQGTEAQPPPPKKRSRKKFLTIIIVVIVVILLVAAVGTLFSPKETFDFTSFGATNITRYHYTNGTVTERYDWPMPNTAKYAVGDPMTFFIRPYNDGNGTLKLSGAASNVTGFTFIGSSLRFPVTVPNTDEPKLGVKVTLAFETPTISYSGPFSFLLFYDWYPSPTPPGMMNNITSVTETQMIAIHSSSGTTVHKNVIQHPDLAGQYPSGSQMTFSELYRYTGLGRENITGIVANTTGFSFASSSPSIPIAMPNSTQPWLTLSMTFNVPSAQYNGSFNYIVFFDQYPDWVDTQYHDLTSVLEVQYVTSHYGSVNNTVRYLQWHNGTAGLYAVGKAINITEPFWNIGAGTLSITNIVANTTGFELITTSPSMPVAVPNSPDASSGNVTVVISFQAPATQYIGHFEYIVYFDNYLV